jgi:hypothetical protein
VRLALAPRALYGNYEAFRFVFAVAQGWAENICYRQRSARAIVMALIINDGVRAVGAIAETFSTQSRRCCSGLPVCMPGTAVSAVSILPAATQRERSFVPGPMPRIRLTPRHQLSVVVALTPRLFENRLNGWIGLKQCVA